MSVWKKISVRMGLGLTLAACVSCGGGDGSSASPGPTSFDGEFGGGSGGGANGGNGGALPSTGVGDAKSPSNPGLYDDGVDVRLSASFPGAETISFGVPVPRGALADASTVRVTANGAQLPATVKELLATHGPGGERTGVASILVQMPATVMTSSVLDVRVHWKGGSPSNAVVQPFASAGVSADSTATATTATRTIQAQNGTYSLVTSAPTTKALFTGKEPRVLAQFPVGYLAATGILGEQVTASDAADPRYHGIAFLSKAFHDFALSAMYEESYPLNPAADSVPDPVTDYEGWLYDRCATFLTAYAHFGEAKFLRHAYRSCSWYAGHVNLANPNLGYFNGKPQPDAKYSHLRGLYVYYALTGDETALAAGKAIADMWKTDPLFVQPYEAGHVRGKDKLWTERLLATSMEGLYYGHALTGDASYLDGMKKLIDTAYAHITGNASALASINPGFSYPPQSCFVHDGAQQAETDPGKPWCSPWMSELMVDTLLRYQEQTNDPRVDEMFVRLGRFLRDVGTAYFTNDVLDDRFLSPSVCYDPNAGDNRRRLVPLYGAALDAANHRDNYGNYDDSQHCPDASALVAVAMRSLRRQGKYDASPIGPFSSEGKSFEALYGELAACAERDFAEQTRPHRDPATWTSKDLAAGAGNPAAFIDQNRIGYPVHTQSPQRRISWWFNTSMLSWGLLHEAQVSVPAVAPGAVEPANCK